VAKSELPDQFLYSRKGPWPQPSPSHPMKCAAEVLHIPPLEQALFAATIGKRYLESQVGYPPFAAAYAAENLDWTGPSDDRFNQIMFDTVYTRFLRPLSGEDKRRCGDNIDFSSATKWWKYDFTAMDLVESLEGTYCAPTRLYLYENQHGRRQSASIEFVNADGSVWIFPGDEAWNLAKLYVLQGAAYHVLFVVHPALHFPMDSVNAITKSSVPIAHPLYQLLFPHTSYSLALDNAVLESAESVVNNNAQGTRFDPLTANGYNLKLLFGAGYAGLCNDKYGDAYPPYNYMDPAMGFESDYGRWLQDYYGRAFLPFCTKVADYILSDEYRGQYENALEYVRRWGLYNNAHVLGFPNDREILDRDVLAKATAIFMWDVSVSHGGDHDSFAWQISPVEKCLRIRQAPPDSRQGHRVEPGNVFTGDDLARAALCQNMFFQPWAIKPNLHETRYAFTSPKLQAASLEFHRNLESVAEDWQNSPFMPLTNPALSTSRNAPPTAEEVAFGYARTIPQSVQY
jgi:hypothetical protein